MINLLISDPVWPLLVLWVHVQVLASGLFIGTVLRRKLRKQRREAALRKINAWQAPVILGLPHSTMVSFSLKITFDAASFYDVKPGGGAVLKEYGLQLYDRYGVSLTPHQCRPGCRICTPLTPMPSDDWQPNELKINM